MTIEEIVEREVESTCPALPTKALGEIWTREQIHRYAQTACLAVAKAVVEERTPLHWVDEGDGYEHAHEGPDDCQVEDTEKADVLVLKNYTSITITHLPVMDAARAKEITEQLYAHAMRLLAAQGTGGEKGKP